MRTGNRHYSRVLGRVAALVCLIYAPAQGLAASTVMPPDSVMIDGKPYMVKTLASPLREARTGSFDRDAQKHHVQGHISACDDVIAIPVGVANGNVSYGGTCFLVQDGQTSSIQVCNDEKTGHFKLQPIGATKPTHKDLEAFVAANCFGG